MGKFTNSHFPGDYFNGFADESRGEEILDEKAIIRLWRLFANCHIIAIRNVSEIGNLEKKLLKFVKNGLNSKLKNQSKIATKLLQKCS